MIERYLRTRYEDGGRGPLAYDCWGLARMARHEVFGLPLLPSYGAVSPSDKRLMTKICERESQHLRECQPAAAAIATAWRGQLCLHVGVCVELDGRLGVLETGSKIGPRWLSVRDFERQYLKVVYYT